jgi:serine/threonine-protein kinase
MATASRPIDADSNTTDLLAAIRRSGILSMRRVAEIQADIRGGLYSDNPVRLAARLVKNGTLTEYQARCLLHGRDQGLVIGRYVILDCLGKGSMGRVYLARHRLMDRLVALKFISGRYLGRTGSLARFFREMRLVGRLDHPNIVRALDADQAGDIPYIVMEYVPGRDLGRMLLERGIFTPAEVVSHAAQAAKALHHAHERGVVHRDVKPSNLLLGEDGCLRVLDLGLGALVDRDGEEEGSFATEDGIAVGTVEYMSPEQVMGGPVDGRSDIYSLGCSMYHMLTGQIPFPEGSRVERLARRIKESPAPAAELRPDIPPGLAEVLDRMLGVRPEDRFATAEEAARALGALETPDRPARAPIGPAEAVLPPSIAGSSDISTSGIERSPSSTEGVVDARPSTWLRFLEMLSDRDPAWVILICVLALLAAFILGFAAAASGRFT